jgi:enoyl reductase
VAPRRRRGRRPSGERVGAPAALGVAGTIDRLGEGVAGLAVGDDVLGWTRAWGTADPRAGAVPTRLVLDGAHVTPRPAGLPWTRAAALAEAALVAHTALRDLRLGPADTLLVTGAAGPVGAAAVQLAASWGATVIGAAEPADHARLRAAGAHPIVLGPGLTEAACAVVGRRVSAVLDTVGGAALRAAVGAAEDRRRVGTTADADATMRLGVRGVRARRSADRLREVAAAAARGDLRVPVAAVYPPRRATDMARAARHLRARGALVLVVG